MNKDHLIPVDPRLKDFGPEKLKVEGELAKRFTLPPFSYLNARDGAWQARKKVWINLGIRSEVGRGANVLGHSVQSGNIDFYSQKRKLEVELGFSLSTEDAQEILTERGLIGTMDSGAGRDGNLLGLSKQAEDYRTRSGAYSKPTAEELRRRDKAATPGGGGGPNSGYNRGGGGKPIGQRQKKADARAFGLGMGANKENGWAVQDEHGSGTSIFDPVLCELMYSWFCPVGGQILDPFAGGSVRGLVASWLNRKYWGCDLRPEQIEANYAQMHLVAQGMPEPVWVVGDSSEVVHAEAPEADFVVACPPYFDLEVYSEDARDLSTKSWEEFRRLYNQIIHDCVARLKNDRFAAFVVGDVRDDAGMYRNLPGLTTACFKQAGMPLYNEMMIATAVGSLPIRMAQFDVSRKLGKTHQNVLVYIKGDPIAAVDAVTGMTLPQRREMIKKRAKERADNVSGGF